MPLPSLPFETPGPSGRASSLECDPTPRGCQQGPGILIGDQVFY